jgi:hypothetical protein
MKAALALALALAAAPVTAEEVASGAGAMLRGLDKVSGTTRDLTLRIGETATFGRLRLSVTDCRYPVSDPTSNAYAHVTVMDGETPAFDGWMIAASPALSALDHPRYDVWVLGCITS